MKVLSILVSLGVGMLAAGCGGATNTNINVNAANTTGGNNSNTNRSVSNQTSTASPSPSEKEIDKTAKAVKNERLQFKAGAEDGSWTREIPANGSLDFMVGAQQGQTFGFEVGYEGRSSDIQVFLSEPGLQDISAQAGPAERKEIKVKKTGDHRITVNNMSAKKATITLYVDIR